MKKIFTTLRYFGATVLFLSSTSVMGSGVAFAGTVQTDTSFTAQTDTYSPTSPPCNEQCPCVTEACNPCTGGTVRNRSGECVCPKGQEENSDHLCVPCPPKCPEGQVMQDEKCVTPCPTGEHSNDWGKCVCPKGQEENSDHLCVPCPPKCPEGQVMQDEKCVTPCPTGEHKNNEGVCVPEVHQTNPTLSVTSTCVTPNQSNGTITVSVKNNNASSVVYQVQVAGVTKSITVAAGQTKSVTFDGLLLGAYDVYVTGNDNTSAQTSVTLTNCTVVTPPTGGGRGGEVLGESTVVTPAPVAGGKGADVQAAQLANTGQNSLTSAIIAFVIATSAILVYDFAPKRQLS